jgi:hypothetical protein
MKSPIAFTVPFNWMKFPFLAQIQNGSQVHKNYCYSLNLWCFKNIIKSLHVETAEAAMTFGVTMYP